MRLRTWILSAALPFAVPAAAATAEDGAVPWSYHGEAGPERWGELAPENAACATGAQQSPIDLVNAVPAAVAPPRILWTAPSAATLTDDGHTWRLDLADAGGLMHGETRYELRQIHVHHPAEHALDGVRHPLEIHFVHASQAGDLAVVAVFVREGDENPDLARLWAAAPDGPGDAPRPVEHVDPRSLLPEDGAQLHYAGSLTTPPCSEIVTWTVFVAPIEASREQIDVFAVRFPGNARPVQPRNRRFLLSTR